MISFEKSEAAEQTQTALKAVAETMMRPRSRYFDEHEHEIPWDYINFMHMAMGAIGSTGLSTAGASQARSEGAERSKPQQAYQVLAHSVEMLSWGDAGLYLVTPRGGLGAAAIEAAGTPEQKKRFREKIRGERPVFAAMAITEAQAGSDNSAIRTRARLDKDTNEWVLNGEKIFVTSGHKALIDTNGYVVVWATLDPTAGREGIRSFVVEAGTPGVKVVKLEEKMGIRVSDTATLVLEDARVPFDNLIGSAEIERSTTGFKGAMATFNVTRPLVAASALGIARAALEEVKAMLEASGVTLRYDLPRQKLTNLEREVIDMERMLRASWLLVIKAVWMSDNGRPNAKEAAMSKLHAGEVVTKITQKAVELMGPLGYSRDYLLEKWFRDAKINDIYEGTGQINRLIAARAILGYSGLELR